MCHKVHTVGHVFTTTCLRFHVFVHHVLTQVQWDVINEWWAIAPRRFVSGTILLRYYHEKCTYPSRCTSSRSPHGAFLLYGQP